MLEVYADETGTHGLVKGRPEPAPGVYGYIGTSEYWETFRKSWSTELARHGAPYFHFRELNRSERAKTGNPYFGWDDAKVNDFIYDMAIVASEKAVPFGGHASIRRIQGPNAKSYSKTYKKAFNSFFEDFGTTMSRHFPRYNDKVPFYFDHNDNEEWVQILETALKFAKWRDCRIGEYSFLDGNDNRGIACQAADLFAYINRQNSESIYEANQYQSLRLLDLIVGRNAFPPGHPGRRISALSQNEWRELVMMLRMEKQAFEASNAHLGKLEQKFYPIRHSPALRVFLGL